MTLRVFGGGGQRDDRKDSGRSSSVRGPHLSSRTGLIALYAVVVALLVGVLTFVSDRRPAAAVVAGGLAFAGAFMFFDKIIGD